MADPLQAALREFRDEMIRQIDKRTAAPIEAAVVADRPDTWAHKVRVKIGTKQAEATYRGRVPTLGEEVWVQRAGAGYKLFTQVPSAAINAGTAGAPNLPNLSPNSPYIHALETWGHSYMDTFAGVTESPYQIANRLFSALGIAWPHARNFGQGGSFILDDWRRMFATAKPVRMNMTDTSWSGRFGPTVFLYGANDVGNAGDPVFENSRVLNDWKNVWRAVFSWFRAGAIYSSEWIYGVPHMVNNPGEPFVDVDVFFPGAKSGSTYTGTWTTPASISGIAATERRTTVAGSAVDIRLPPRHPGTAVTIYLLGERGQTGATVVTVSNPGGTMPSFTLSTNDRVRLVPVRAGAMLNPSIVPVRITTLPAGDGTTSQTIRVTATTLASGGWLSYLGWSIEAPYPPLLVPANIPPVADWTITGYNTNGIPGNTTGAVMHWPSWPNNNGIQTGPSGVGRAIPQDGDTWCRTHYNPALAAVAAEFLPIGSVSVADLAAVVDGTTHPELYGAGDLGGADYIHPNMAGKAVVVNAFLAAMNRISLDPRHLIAPMEANETADAAAMMGDST